MSAQTFGLEISMIMKVINSTEMVFQAKLQRKNYTEYLLIKMARVTCPEKIKNYLHRPRDHSII
jgi:hypothetical protein